MGVPRRSEPAVRHYRLTHDYLVPSIRQWLTRKQKETRKGRAELRVQELSRLWSATKDGKYLLNFLEVLYFRTILKHSHLDNPAQEFLRASLWNSLSYKTLSKGIGTVVTLSTIFIVLALICVIIVVSSYWMSYKVNSVVQYHFKEDEMKTSLDAYEYFFSQHPEIREMAE